MKWLDSRAAETKDCENKVELKTMQLLFSTKKNVTNGLLNFSKSVLIYLRKSKFSQICGVIIENSIG